MTTHYVDFEFKGDHYPVSTPVTLVAETDVQPASNRPDAEDERVLVRHWFLINNTDADGRPVEYLDARYRPDRFEYRLDMQAHETSGTPVWLPAPPAAPGRH